MLLGTGDRAKLGVFRACFLLTLLLALPLAAHAGGPKYVAGASYFNSAVLGQPIHWSAGAVHYYVDQGPLSATISNQQATAMVDAAAALWSAVPTAAVTLTNMGPLAEDVDGANIAAASQVITAPADITPSATGFPVAVLFDQDGSVIDTIFGTGTSQPTRCEDNGVLFWIDNVSPDATIAHAVLVLNGLCTNTPALLQMMNYELERAFGRILNLDYSQVNPEALASNILTEPLGWPVMEPLSGTCSATGGQCIPNPDQLRYDDIAALSRIYPVTSANLVGFPGKQPTAANTISIQGTVSFRTGLGMQGVNVVARPLDASGNPLYQYTVTFVSGGYFNGNHGNPVTGYNDASGNPLAQWGSSDPTMQGWFDLSAMPLPPGVTTADYQITFEAINPLYILTESVGPYIDGQPTPSGTLSSITVQGLSAGATKTLIVEIPDSAATPGTNAIGSEAAPRPLAPSGTWCGRISQVGQTDWFTFPVRGNRIFSIIAQAVDETGAPTSQKAMPAIGIWDAFDPVGTNAPAVGYAPALNGYAPGESWLRVATQADDIVRIAVADQRGDGRPDYAYNAWVLYADTVEPLRLPASGGPIVIHGMGFRLADTVLVGGQPALVTSISPNEITAIAPPAAKGVTGSVDVEVDDLAIFYAAAVIPSGVSYDSGTGDALTLVTAPMNTVPLGVPNPFTVIALGPDLTPAGGVTVLFTVTSGAATLGCGLNTCAVTTTGDGIATMSVSAINSTLAVVTAALTSGSSLQAQFVGGAAPNLAALNPKLSVAAGAVVTWPVQALVLQNGLPLGNQLVAWQSPTAGLAAQGSASAITAANGIASQILTVGPLAEGQTASINACLNGTSQCVAFSAFGARPEYAYLQAVAGITQSISASATPAQVTLRLLDMDGNQMAGGTVALNQALYAWSPPCPDYGPCAAAELLATQVSTATSALDGSVTFTPLSLPGVPTNLLGLATTGNTATLPLAIEEHP